MLNLRSNFLTLLLQLLLLWKCCVLLYDQDSNICLPKQLSLTRPCRIYAVCKLRTRNQADMFWSLLICNMFRIRNVFHVKQLGFVLSSIWTSRHISTPKVTSIDSTRFTVCLVINLWHIHELFFDIHR